VSGPLIYFVLRRMGMMNHAGKGTS
jgi:hypothetical protein